MKVKFELENTDGIRDLTSGKVYNAKLSDCGENFVQIVDDVGVGITIVTEQCGPSSCGHLRNSATWQIVEQQ